MKRGANVAPSVEISTNGKRDVLSREEKLQAVEVVGLSMHRGKSKNTMRLIESGSLGARDSAHDVFFAQDTKPQEGMPNAVAIKRFRRQQAAVLEMENLAEARRRGFPTLEPAGEGIYDLGEMGTALVTKRIPRFTTMNQIGWQNHYVGQEGYGQLASALQNIGGFVGRLHAAGMVHQDLQVKNIAQGPTGDFIVFDAEGALFFDPTDNDPAESVNYSGKCYEDIATLGISLVDKRFLAPVKKDIFEQEIADNLITPYLDNGGHPGVLDEYDRLMADIHARREAMPSLSPAEIGRLALV